MMKWFNDFRMQYHMIWSKAYLEEAEKYKGADPDSKDYIVWIWLLRKSVKHNIKVAKLLVKELKVS